MLCFWELLRDMPFTDDEWMSVIEEHVKPKFVDLNKAAFKRGQKA